MPQSCYKCIENWSIRSLTWLVILVWHRSLAWFPETEQTPLLYQWLHRIHWWISASHCHLEETVCTFHTNENGVNCGHCLPLIHAFGYLMCVRLLLEKDTNQRQIRLEGDLLVFFQVWDQKIDFRTKKSTLVLSQNSPIFSICRITFPSWFFANPSLPRWCLEKLKPVHFFDMFTNE